MAKKLGKNGLALVSNLEIKAEPMVCKHGSLRRSCEICELRAELAEARKLIRHLIDSGGRYPARMQGVVSAACLAPVPDKPRCVAKSPESATQGGGDG